MSPNGQDTAQLIVIDTHGTRRTSRSTSSARCVASVPAPGRVIWSPRAYRFLGRSGLEPVALVPGVT